MVHELLYLVKSYEAYLPPGPAFERRAPVFSMNIESADLENPESDGEFAFETAHLALRGNNDYCELLKYIVRLEALKVQALKDIEELSEQQSRALDDPFKFVENLKLGKVKFPLRQSIPEPPNIDWNSYDIDTTLDDDIRDVKPNKEELDNSMKVRGRKFTDNKPESFNQLWSCEEQKRLEELLEIYPEEAIEARRYKKIAEALGTRTPIQVMSRIQKYFAKLAKAGLPIPGRAPKRVGRDKTKSLFYKKSTFFPQLHVPVKMEDPFDSGDAPECSTSESKNGAKHVLELLKAAKEQRLLDEVSPIYQSKTMCVGCLKTGFLGARWTDNAGTDYCTDCVVKFLPAEKLMPLHVPVKMEDPFDSGDAPECSTSESKNGAKHVLELLKAAKEQRLLDEVSPIYQSKTMCVGCLKTGFLGARWTDNAGTDYCTDCVVKFLPAEKLIPVRSLA